MVYGAEGLEGLGAGGAWFALPVVLPCEGATVALAAYLHPVPPTRHPSCMHSTPSASAHQTALPPLTHVPSAPDARSKILLGNKSLIDESPRTLRIREELIATNAFSRTWQSTYMADMRDFSRRPNTVA